MSGPSRRLAPGPRGSVVMGNLAAYKRDPVDMLMRLRREHGDVVRNRLGPFLTHALAHPDHVQHVLQDNQRNYSRGRFYENFKLFFGDGLLTTDGDFWRRHRRAVQPLFHRKQVELHASAVGDSATALVQRWLARPPGAPVEVVEEMMTLSLEMLGLMVFNTDISVHARAVGPAVRFGIEAMMPQGNLDDFLPRWLPTRFNRRIREARHGIDTIIAQIVDDHRHARCATSDVISLLLSACHPETGAAMTEREVHDEVMTVFLAGHETTGTGLAWTLYALAQNPLVLRQLRDELDAVLGGRAPTLDDLGRLPYLDKVVNESLRMYPPIWGYTRDLIDDDEIGGFHLPAGSSVFMSPYVTHRHPEFWRVPDAFDPENFADEPRHRFAWFPFGGGMRKCIGFQTALLQMRVLTAMVAQHLDLACVPGHDTGRGALISLRPLHGIKLIVRPRAVRHPGAAARAQVAEPVSPATAGCPVSHADAGAAQAVAGVTEVAPPAAPGAAVSAVAPVPMSTPTPTPTPIPTPMPMPIFSSTPVPAAAPFASEAASAWRFEWSPIDAGMLDATPSPRLAGRRILVVNGRPATAARVAAALARACAHAVVFAPEADADIERLARECAEGGRRIDGIVDLGLEETFDASVVDAWVAPMRCTVAALQACYETWSVEPDTERLFYLAVTWMDGMMGHATDAPLRQPLGGLWAGLAKTLPQEMPNCNVRVLDLSHDEAGRVEHHVASELYRWGLFEIGRRGGRRYTLRAMRAELGPAAAAPPLGRGDVVLFSGGARGIGLLCARELARRHGCTVVLTGREALPDADAPWVALDDTSFERESKAELRRATASRLPAVILAETARKRRLRAARRAIDALAAEGLDVRYRACDATDVQEVRVLCDEFGPALRMIVHNAGVDRPLRLSQKTFATFAEVVRTKVTGFQALWSAVAARPALLQFCNVGSLVGRWGGMTGETDYAAANEALARLGQWAARGNATCVKTIAWPTWDSVGMITNFAVTKRYVAPMPVDEGLAHWLREIGLGTSGEVMFMGPVGRALTPVQINGFPPLAHLPNSGRLGTLLHHAGRPTRFVPSRRIETLYEVRRGEAPWVDGLRVSGRPVLPVSLLMEHLLQLSEWLVPEDFESLPPRALTGIVAHLHAVPSPESDIRLRSEATARREGGAWRVDVRCEDAATGHELLRFTIACEASERAAAAPADLLPAPSPTVAATGALAGVWNASVFRGAEWVDAGQQAGAVRVGRLDAARAEDLWACPNAPELRLPVAHLEAILRACPAGLGEAGATAPPCWQIDRVDLFDAAAPPAAPALAVAVLQHAAQRFSIVDEDGRVLMALHGVRLHAAAFDVPPIHSTPAITQEFA